MATTNNDISNGPSFLPIFGSVRVSLGGKEERISEGEIRSWNKHGTMLVQRASERSGLIMHTDLHGKSMNIPLDAGRTFISNGKWSFLEINYESFIVGELISRTRELEPRMKEWVCRQVQWDLQVEGITLASVPRVSSFGWAIARVDKVTNKVCEIRVNLVAQKAYEIAHMEMSINPLEIAVVYNQGTPKAVFYLRGLCAGG